MRKTYKNGTAVFQKCAGRRNNKAEEEVETSQIVLVSVRRVPSCRTGSRFVFLGRKQLREGQKPEI